MKTILTLLISLFLVAGLKAQSVKQDTIYITTQAYKDSVVVRWAPGSTHLWKVANKVGYKVERKKSGEKDFRVVSTGSIKPYTLKEWKQKADTTNVHVATAAQVLLGSMMMQPQKAITFSQKLLTSEEEKNRLALALYSAEFSIQAANGLALRWVDKGVDKASKYYYKVSLFTASGNVKVVSGVAVQHASNIFAPPPVANISAEGKDGVIEIRWDKAENDKRFSGYFIERSDDGKKFTRLKDVPFKTVTHQATDTHHIFEDKISIYNKDYYYRVQGITSFADLGAYSSIVKAHSRDLSAPAPPSMLNVQSLNDKEVKLTWTDNPIAPDHAGYFIGRGTSIHGPFQKLNTTPYKITTREYIDNNPILHKPNFYTIIAVDKLGNENQSIVAMAILKDSTPPAQPKEITGHIDTLGVVSLAWRLGSEEDLLGYRVYRADHPTAEYIQVTSAPVPGNFFMDTIPLNTLTKKAYYKVAAFDFNYNPSEYSATLEIQRPDYAPPVKPVIKNYTVKKDTIVLQWVPSTSKDVTKHIVYRKESSYEWTKLIELADKRNHYLDVTTKPKTTYSYSVEAIDAAGLSSGRTAPIHVVSSLPDRSPVKNVTGAYDKNVRGFRLNWDYEVQGTFKFLIYRMKDEKEWTVHASVPGKERSYTDTKFYRSQKGYSYAIKVLYSDGTESLLSEKIDVTFKP